MKSNLHDLEYCKPTCFLLDVFLLTVRFLPLVPLLTAFPFLPAELVFFLLTFLRFPAKNNSL